MLPGFFSIGGRTMTAMRFGKNFGVKSTFQIKHRLLLWWLKSQAAKDADEAIGKADHPEQRPPMHVHEAT
jgi:hypothetical protein